MVYAEQHSEIKLMCEVDLDIATSMWYKNGQVSWASGQFLPKSLPLVYSLSSCEEPLSCQKLPTCADFNCILSLLHSFAHFPSLFFVFPPSVSLSVHLSVCLSGVGWLAVWLARWLLWLYSYSGRDVSSGRAFCSVSDSGPLSLNCRIMQIG